MRILFEWQPMNLIFVKVRNAAEENVSIEEEGTTEMGI